VTYTTIGGTQAPLWLGQTTGAFSKNGVNVQSQLIDGNTATQALVAKETDVLLQTAVALITADLNGNVGMVEIGSVLSHSQFALLVAPSIKTADDLRGKGWASDKPGTATDYQTQLLLKLLNLKPSDVMIRELGGNNAYTALLAGQVVAAPVIPPVTFQAQAKGYSVLKTTYDQPYQSVGLMVLKSRIEELKPALLGFLAGYRESIQSYNAQPDVAISVLRLFTKESDESLLKQTYDFYKTQAPFQADMQPTLEGIQNMLDFLSPQIPAAKTAKPEQLVDTSLLAQLPKV
jgi:ABC-type nitrate/sulfonate/bicarbonate transport system substrate-binding protein